MLECAQPFNATLLKFLAARGNAKFEVNSGLKDRRQGDPDTRVDGADFIVYFRDDRPVIPICFRLTGIETQMLGRPIAE